MRGKKFSIQSYSIEIISTSIEIISSSTEFISDSTGCPKKTENYWNNLLLKFECPTKKLNVMMRKILARCMY